MSVPSFENVAKAAGDLIKKPYLDAHKLEVRGTGSNGVTFVAESILGDIPAPKKAGEPAAPALAVRAEAVSVYGGFKVDKVAVDSNKDVAMDFSVPAGVKGLNLSFKSVDGSRRTAAKPDVKAALALSYTDAHVNSSAEVDALKKTAGVSVVGGFQEYLAGVSAKFDLGEGVKATDYDVTVGYKAKDIAASIATEKKFSAIAGNLFVGINSQWSVAAQAKVGASFFLKPAAEGAEAAAPAAFDLAAGFQYKQTPDVTIAGKLNAARQLNLSYAQQISPLAKVTVSSVIDGAQLAGANNSVKVALALSM